jgi:hypothetical protein
MNTAEAARLFREFLAGNTIVSVVVLPGLCEGLAEFEKAKPLRIDLSEAFSPPMWPTVTDDGLSFRASFSKVDRAVTVPWCALVWAGVPNTTAGAAPTQKAVAALETPDVAKPQVREGGVLIHADFGKKRGAS